MADKAPVATQRPRALTPSVGLLSARSGSFHWSFWMTRRPAAAFEPREECGAPAQRKTTQGDWNYEAEESSFQEWIYVKFKAREETLKDQDKMACLHLIVLRSRFKSKNLCYKGYTSPLLYNGTITSPNLDSQIMYNVLNKMLYNLLQSNRDVLSKLAIMT